MSIPRLPDGSPDFNTIITDGVERVIPVINGQALGEVLAMMYSAGLRDGVEDIWYPIATAPKDGTVVWVYVAERDLLPAFQCICSYHPDAGWCVDELREVTHWRPLPGEPG